MPYETGNVSGIRPGRPRIARAERRLRNAGIWPTNSAWTPIPTHFEMVPANIMYEFGAYGLPGRFSHWTLGKAYYRMKTQYDYGLSKIYEMVINSNPSYAFLMERTVSVAEQDGDRARPGPHRLLQAQRLFRAAPTAGLSISASLHADRIRQYEQEHGTDVVEKFLDAVLSIEEHIDPNIRIKGQAPAPKEDEMKKPPYESPYADLWDLDDRKTARDQEKEREKEKAIRKKYPPQPEKDIVRFLMLNSRELDDWQRDIMEMVHNEAIYFLPQRQTKIMNEGWASLWHQRIVRELDLTDGEFAEYAQLSSGVLSPNSPSVSSSSRTIRWCQSEAQPSFMILVWRCGRK